MFENLNENQRAAVEYTSGPQLVIAGAGSGKTRVLTFKIAYLLEMGLNPWNILALTFTNKAATEMKNRIGELVGDKRAERLYMGTFHSIFARILRHEAEHIGFTRNFTIYDESDSRSLIKAIIKELALDDKTYKPAAIHARISMAKNRFILPEQYAAKGELLERDRRERVGETYKIYQTYVQRCRTANAMDFDDLLVLTHQLLKSREDVRQKYAAHFQYVLVDEYQDTNHVQQCIVTLLTQEHRRICVVGDDAQSIYGFRGADIDNILDFQTQFPEAKLFKLEQNYRSTQHIVQAANSLIKHNQRQIHKEVFSRNDKGEKLTLKPVYSDKEEAAVVCRDIKRIMHNEGTDYSSFAILYRTNSQSRPFEEEMRRQSIPYRIVGGQSFYQRKEIKDIIAYFRLAVNTNDEEAFKRIVNYPARGIGATTLDKISTTARQYEASMWNVIALPNEYPLGLSSGTQKKLENFRSLIDSFAESLQTVNAFELGRRIIMESGIHADLFSSTDAESLARQENLQEFISSLQEFVETRREEGTEAIYLADYLQEVSLLSEVESEGNDESRVTLMTVHSAKGLEFPTVFIVGLEENIFPSPRACDSPRELEEERRLLYVAITRAERHCIMTCAKNRFRYGRMEFDTPSRFIADIDPAFINIESTGEHFDDIPQRTRQSFGRPINRPYTGSRTMSEGIPHYGSSRFLNSRPVASQFIADPKPNPLSQRRDETAVDPLSPAFKQKLASSGADMRKISRAINHGEPQSADIPQNTADIAPVTTAQTSAGVLREGNIIEHQRFGIGKVIKLEGTGENAKATVEFKNTGIKQLLLKFARFKIVS